MKCSLVSFAAIVAGLSLCGPAWAVSCIYDFDGLTAGAPLWEQDIWRHGDNEKIDVETEANAKGMYTEAEQLRWTGFDGNVAKVNISLDGTYHTSENNYNGSPWSLSIPSDATEVRFSYTVFARSNHSILVGLRLEDYTHVVRLGIDPIGSRWRLRDHHGDATYSTVAAPASDRTSYRLTAVLDYTDPTTVYADMLVEDLTAGTPAVEVISHADLYLTTDYQRDPSNLSRFYLRPSDYASIDNLTVTTGEVGPPIPGDANLDNIVNDQDASILAAHWQQAGNWGDGDFNNDGIVNDQDASILAAHWQESQEGAAPVPEPSTLIGLLALGLAGLVALRRR